MPAISPALSLAAVVPPQVLDDGSASSKPTLSSRLTLPLAVRRRLQPERNVSSVIYAIRPFRHSTDCSATSVAGTSESNEDHVDHVATRHTLDLPSSLDPEDRDHADSIMELQRQQQGSPSKLRHFTSLQQMGRDKIEQERLNNGMDKRKITRGAVDTRSATPVLRLVLATAVSPDCTNHHQEPPLSQNC
jgi:hypothetical protein